MYWAGFTQSMMWKQFNPDGTLAYPEFLETVTHQLKPFFMMRALGGALYIVGVVIMMVNLVKTAKAGSFIAQEEDQAPALVNPTAGHKGEHWHAWIERRPVRFLIFSLIAILIGGAAELIPTIMVKENVPTISSVTYYTPLELEGQDIYIREGCNNCHSQMVRPFRDEVMRYAGTDGEYSKGGEFAFAHPHLWGSKRTGPDLARSGKGNAKARGAIWHYKHMIDPTSVSEGSIMPTYEHLTEPLDYSMIKSKIGALRKVGVPYPDKYEDTAEDLLKTQAEEIYEAVIKDPEIQNARPDMELMALIAYLDRLGSDILKAGEENH